MRPKVLRLRFVGAIIVYNCAHKYTFCLIPASRMAWFISGKPLFEEIGDVKPFAIGRKNWLFSNTERGADSSAMFYSVIETAKENGLKPFEYLNFIFKTAPNLDLAHNPDLVKKLLPWNAPPECRNDNQILKISTYIWDEV